MQQRLRPDLCYRDEVKCTPRAWVSPPADYSPAPFWFLNDRIEPSELRSQLADFRSHGVYAVVMHPRLGLPADTPFLGETLLSLYGAIIDEAERTGMWVMLYDEGMYPSGSASGQVVARDRRFRPHAFFARAIDSSTERTAGQGVATLKRSTTGESWEVYDRRVADGSSVIRGIHYVNEATGEEEQPEAADILNPDAVECFLEIVYDRLACAFGDRFRTVVRAMFTDEPSFLARNPEPGAVPGNCELLPRIADLIGYDPVPQLLSLFFDDEPGAEAFRRDYFRALETILSETYYRRLSRWCDRHGIALTGHPSAPDTMGHQRFFDIPGQDLVWRYVVPGEPSTLEGAQSTGAKCASSAAIHARKQRNLNEYCGAYGHEFTFEEMRGLTRWLALRGCNLFVPHAFYYSIRGPRREERPPDVGPNSSWWDRFGSLSDEISRYSWLNTVARSRAQIAVLTPEHAAPWRSASVCYRHQYDFNYLDVATLRELEPAIDAGGVSIVGLRYTAVIDEPMEPGSAGHGLPVDIERMLAPLAAGNRLLRFDPTGDETDEESQLINRIALLTERRVLFRDDHPDIRLRELVIGESPWFLIGNEGTEPARVVCEFTDPGTAEWLDPVSGDPPGWPGIGPDGEHDAESPIEMPPLSVAVVRIVEATPRASAAARATKTP